MTSQIQKQTCDKFDPTFYPRFKKWCDDYFYIKHQDERRGLGGIFFDDLNDYDQEMLLSFSNECANSVIPAYIPIIEKRKDLPFTEHQKAWQQLRRGRYVEFNLVYDGYNIWTENWRENREYSCISPTNFSVGI